MNVLEQASSIQHDIWAHWMTYLLEVSSENEDGSVTIPASHVERWKRQIRTPYESLSEEERASDREQALKLLKFLEDKKLIAPIDI